MNRYFLLVLHLISIVFLGLGLSLDVLRIDITASFFIEINLFNERRSVLGTLLSLWQSSNYLPFLLISLFGVLIPVVKSVFLLYGLAIGTGRSKWQKWLVISTRWAMADVFAVSIFIAFLGARAMKNTSAALEPGFYFFTAYVVLSAVIVSFFTKMNSDSLPFHS